MSEMKVSESFANNRTGTFVMEILIALDNIEEEKVE